MTATEHRITINFGGACVDVDTLIAKSSISAVNIAS
jgi:hypothetical protein